MDTITYGDKTFRPYIPEKEINAIIERMAAEITAAFKDKDPVFLGVLNGSFMFAGTLLRNLHFPCRISFVKLASYSGTQSTAEIFELIGLKEDLRGKNVIIIEDIIDTGLTISWLREQVLLHVPADLRIATMLFKPEAFRGHYKIDYIGKEVPNEFIIGYGLDYNGYGRNLADIFTIDTPTT